MEQVCKRCGQELSANTLGQTNGMCCSCWFGFNNEKTKQPEDNESCGKGEG